MIGEDGSWFSGQREINSFRDPGKDRNPRFMKIKKKTAGESLKDFSHSSLFLKKLILTCHNGMFSYFPNFYA